ncbi:hypothetical protein [Streptomyces lunaelactis]|nr:hypothetical protein [Streptomyces lunaelactis]
MQTIILATIPAAITALGTVVAAFISRNRQSERNTVAGRDKVR